VIEYPPGPTIEWGWNAIAAEAGVFLNEKIQDLKPEDEDFDPTAGS
jgi:hypothetical protein